ncbi:hypothetical protein [Rhodopseudomonas sp.]|uniref:hypothetical protein n=1 Tax=Rhodopseudomonas sp. TaxID=1078 RepID=UPI0039E5373C
MSAATQSMADLVALARATGTEAAPTKLLEAINAMPQPDLVWSGEANLHDLFLAVEENGNLALAVAQFTHAQGVNSAPLVELIRWTRNTIVNWSAEADPDARRLIAVFMVIQAAAGRPLLDALADEIRGNSELATALAKRFAAVSLVIAPQSGAAIPIWEAEAVKTFLAADKAKDWEKVTLGWRQLGVALPFMGLQKLMARCLNIGQRDLLLKIVGSYSTSLMALLVADALSVEDSLWLARDSANEYVRFAALAHALERTRPHPRFSPEIEQIVTAMLIDVAASTERWSAWMAVFNRYPTRYPQLQIPLGRALAAVSDEAREAYVASLDLTATPPPYEYSRPQIADCLREFRAVASPAQRHALWKSAFDRWSAWDFGAATSEHMMQITGSTIDYAVMGYIMECLDATERASAVTHLEGRISSLPDAWHTSFTDFISDHNRLMSRLRPYACATQLADGDDWLLLRMTSSTTNGDINYQNLYYSTR